VAALLAGAWENSNENDREVVSELAGGADYYDYESGLRPLLRSIDPPIEREQTIWMIRAPVDAFTHLGHLISHDNFQRFEAVVSKVFSRIEPEPDPDDIFDREGKRTEGSHSSYLRDGLATNLLLIACLAEQIELDIPGGSGQDFANKIVGAVPGLSNNHRVIASLRDELPFMMEAAPDPLLKALEQMLEGDEPLLKNIFKESDDIFAPSSPHTNLLWSLERLAWHPQFLPRICTILSKLAAIDPGGNISNRPINSLRSILLSWNPQTNANLDVRLAVLDSIILNEPDIGWELTTKLLPTSHDSNIPTTPPQYRDAGASEKEKLTYAVVWKTQFEVIKRAVQQSDSDPDRLAKLIETLSNARDDGRQIILKKLDEYLQSNSFETARVVWRTLRDEVHRHKQFSTADWSFGEDQLSILEEMLERHGPAQRFEQVSWLFDDWTPYLEGGDGYSDEEVERARVEAIKSVLEVDGGGGIKALLEFSQMPQFVVSAYVKAVIVPEKFVWIFDWDLGQNGRLTQLSRVASSEAYLINSDEWERFLRGHIEETSMSAEDAVQLLTAFPDKRETWDYVTSLGPEIENLYWTNKDSWRLSGSLEDLVFAISKYLDLERGIAALVAAQERILEIEFDLSMEILDKFLEEVGKDIKQVNHMLTYSLSEVLNKLQNSPSIDKLKLAKREYALLPLLEFDRKNLTVHQIMAEEPEFYVQVLCDVFRSQNEATEAVEPEDVSEQARAKAHASYRLLSNFDIIPGLQGTEIDITVLRKWIAEVRRLAAEKGRAEIIDQYIGHLLAHAPVDQNDGFWPAREIRELLEELEAEEIEIGVRVERFNMRGVTSRGAFEGGDQERDIAKQYQNWADGLTRWPRTRALLEELAVGYERDAEREDAEVRRRRLRT
jgi:hypothetical protein